MGVEPTHTSIWRFEAEMIEALILPRWIWCSFLSAAYRLWLKRCGCGAGLSFRERKEAPTYTPSPAKAASLSICNADNVSVKPSLQAWQLEKKANALMVVMGCL